VLLFFADGCHGNPGVSGLIHIFYQMLFNGEGYGNINTKGRCPEAVAKGWGSRVWDDFYGPYVQHGL
jgi:hypothetical protein